MQEMHVKIRTEAPKDYTGKLIYPGGDETYLVDGLYHKEDGYAIVWKHYGGMYFLRGNHILPPSHESFLFYVSLLKLKGML
jgi:hypothetical protein